MTAIKRVAAALVLAFAAAFLSGGADRAHATDVQPLLVELTYGDVGAMSGAIRVTSTSDTQAAIEITVFERVFDETGAQTSVPADDDFIIFPPQALLEPRATQVFRLQYIGEPVEAAKNYYFVVSQVPVALDETANRIDVIVRFSASVNIAPASTSAQIAVAETTYGSDEAGPYLTVVVENTGARHAYLSDIAMVVSQPDGTVTAITGGEFRARAGDTLVPAQGRRSFRYALDPEAPEGEWEMHVREGVWERIPLPD